jgi:hypothetical protein
VYSRRVSSARAPIAIVCGTALSYIIGIAIGMPLLLPVLNVLAAFPFMVAALRRGNVPDAIVRMLIWAASMAVCATMASYLAPAETSTLFLHGDAYRREMFEFVLTGRGAEGNIRIFLPQHLLHATAFCALALATGSILAMPLGAVLMNYMAYYVGALGAASLQPIKAMALAWVPWALIRIASFVVLGVVLGGPVLGRVGGFEYRLRDQRRWIALALIGLVVDVILKWAIAPSWRGLIRAAAGW